MNDTFYFNCRPHETLRNAKKMTLPAVKKSIIAELHGFQRINVNNSHFPNVLDILCLFERLYHFVGIGVIKCLIQ